VCRQNYYVDEMVSKLCQSTIEPDGNGTRLTVTGVGGYGKTTIVIGLLYVIIL